MADITTKERAGSTKIIGSDSAGNESTYVESTTAGGVHANLRDDSGNEFGTEANPINAKTLENLGATTAYTGTATTTFANVPSSAGGVISGCLIKPLGNNFEVSFDGGTSYLPISRNSVFTWDVKGEITQLRVRTSSSTSDYEILLNTEPV